MLPRNLNIILIAACVSLLCYITYRRARTAMIVGDALELIDQRYVDPVDADKLLTEAMNGMTRSLDEHSSYIPDGAYEEFQDSISQEFAGIGIFVDQPEEGKPVRVRTPLVNSPALTAGIKPDDLIAKVDGEDVSAMKLKDVSDRLKGPIGTSVAIDLQRGEDIVSVSVERARIEVQSVIGDHRGPDNAWVYRLKSDPHIAYIRLSSFGEKTVKELSDVLRELNNEYDGLVLDLRGNSGGLLDAACEVSDMFLEGGRIVSTKVRDGKFDEAFDATESVLVDPDIPIAVLINGGSASASEIVAGCLQDHKRAVIVGTRSYGKGTVQNIFPLKFGRSALRLTIARYYRPSERNIHRSRDATEDDEWGVTPDDGFVIPLEKEALIALSDHWRKASFPVLPNSGDDPASEPTSSDATDAGKGSEDPLSYDPQLQKSVEQLRKSVGGLQDEAEREAAIPPAKAAA